VVGSRSGNAFIMRQTADRRRAWGGPLPVQIQRPTSIQSSSPRQAECAAVRKEVAAEVRARPAFAKGQKKSRRRDWRSRSGLNECVEMRPRRDRQRRSAARARDSIGAKRRYVRTEAGRGFDWMTGGRIRARGRQRHASRSAAFEARVFLVRTGGGTGASGGVDGCKTSDQSPTENPQLLPCRSPVRSLALPGAPCSLPVGALELGPPCV
jgi:hypothetical protein